MTTRRLSDETFVELVMAASEALREKGHSEEKLSNWMRDTAELLRERTTLRDQFAKAAMTALLPTIQAEAVQTQGLETLLERTATVSYKMAAAMLKARGGVK